MPATIVQTLYQLKCDHPDCQATYPKWVGVFDVKLVRSQGWFVGIKHQEIVKILCPEHLDAKQFYSTKHGGYYVMSGNSVLDAWESVPSQEYLDYMAATESEPIWVIFGEQCPDLYTSKDMARERRLEENRTGQSIPMPF